MRKIRVVGVMRGGRIIKVKGSIKGSIKKA